MVGLWLFELTDWKITRSWTTITWCRSIKYLDRLFFFFWLQGIRKNSSKINKKWVCWWSTLSKGCFVCHRFYEQDNFLTGISPTLLSIHSLIITLVTYLKRVSTKMAHSSLNIPKLYYTLPDYAILSHSSLLNIVHTTVMKLRLEYNVLNHLLQTCQVIRYTIDAN